ncbi:hypothetical protein BC351_00385 [Paenibacillus ferrarius]|uniref:Uncharacterized protein n=1 Tax=Paenibacillus ferrarius TaxID=1469647 RepID=A0A1V4HTA6_9BACL|nr:hypothetical protein [Paenibacillus ferrarius]OPH61733.1 hypothetical protein BC351_00385 [Paenibacillus ferrarius]
MPNGHNIPINVILLPDLIDEYESLVDVYVEIINECKSSTEVRAALKMIVEEAEELNTKKVFVHLIQSLAELMDYKLKY